MNVIRNENMANVDAVDLANIGQLLLFYLDCKTNRS
jgi:hypothetical protein